MRSSIGKKAVMAVTGFILVGFLVGHMLGNLQIFLGPTKINEYAKALHDLPEVLWFARSVLLIAIVLHIWAAVSVWRENRVARPVPYAMPNTMRASFSSRIMILSGLVLLAFILFHLAHFTLLWVDPAYASLKDEEERHDVYRMVLSAFRNPLYVGIYLVGLGVLLSHLSHGVTSMFKSLGLINSVYQPLVARIGPSLAWVLFVGFGAIPVAILLGYGS